MELTLTANGDGTFTITLTDSTTKRRLAASNSASTEGETMNSVRRDAVGRSCSRGRRTGHACRCHASPPGYRPHDPAFHKCLRLLRLHPLLLP